MVTQSGANPVWRIWGDRKDQCDFNPFVNPRAFAALKNKLGKARSVNSYDSICLFRKALILSKLLDSGEGQKQNLQLQSAAAVWREIWGQSC